MHSPFAVLLGQVRMGGVACQESVELSGRGIEIASTEAVEHSVQAVCQCDEAGCVVDVQLGDRGWIDGQDIRQHGRRWCVGRFPDQAVDQVYRHERTRIHVTVEMHLTCHIATSTVVTVKLRYTRYAGATMTTRVPEPVLRPATANDSDALADIWYHGWRDGHLGHVPATLLAYRRPADFRSRMPGQLECTTVATIGERLVGFVTVRADEVEQLYVDAAARGTGIAAKLLRFGESAIAATYQRAWLVVVAGNARARRFYERQGWQDRGAMDYAAATADGGTVVVPSRCYEKIISRPKASSS